MIDQNPDTSTAPNEPRWRNTITAVSFGSRAASHHSPTSNSALIRFSIGSSRSGENRTNSRPASSAIGSDSTADNPTNSGSRSMSKLDNNTASRDALLATNDAITT